MQTLIPFKPNLLEELMNSTEPVPKKLDPSAASSLDIQRKTYINDESLFRFDFNEEAMAVEKLREGISKFAADAETLKEILKGKLEKA
jgi:transaldolase